MLLPRLRPTSLFLSSLLLLVTSSPLPVDSKETPPELRQLTANTFDQSIKKDTWFVEFFSPWCGHCKAFKPTWEKLVASRDDAPRLNLAQVDCVANGDLCNAEGVKYYPFLRLYQNTADGKQTQQVYDESRTLENLEAFLDKHVPKAKPAPPSHEEHEEQDDAHHEQQAKAHEDDEEHTQQYHSSAENKPKYNLDGRVLALTKDTFQNKVASEPTFVKFFAPWCGHCQKLAPKWEELALTLKGIVNVAEVNCDQFGSVCSNVGIEGYPTLVFYLNGKKIDYTGSKTLPAMETFVRKAVAPGIVKVNTADEFNEKLENEDVAFLLLHSGNDRRILDLLAAASQALLGDPPIFASTSRKLYAQYGLNSPTTSLAPVLLSIKSHSTSRYASKLELDGIAKSGEGATDKIENWLQRNRFPVAGKLAMDNYYSVMKNPSNPLVVLLAVDGGESPRSDEEGSEHQTSSSDEHLPASTEAQIKKLTDISKLWAKTGESASKERETVFVWMDGRKWARWLKNMYGIKDVSDTGVPGLVVVDHSALLYYDTDGHDAPLTLDRESVFSALRAIYSGDGKPKHSESILERIARSMNNKALALEAYIRTHVKTTIFAGIVFVILLFYAFRFCLDSDLPSTNDYYVSEVEKKERGRLD
ncbi:thioredoxin-domain-containing protein [Serendipita vermifera]|nr:thioredoxin-domain-containing protein [Serendipita vermifera]